MGNTQSAPSPREQYRLSKPKTNASSSNLLALAYSQTERDISSTPPKVFNIGETEAVVTSPSGERRSRPEARPKLRAHLFGSIGGSSRNEPPEGDCERRCGLGELVNGVRDRLSRSGSPSSQPSSGRGSSTNLIHSSGASRLVLLPESSTLDSEEARRLHQDIRAKASTDELAAFNHLLSPVDEAAPNNPVLSPIRRRSLLTPGIATRVPDDILRKPPPRSKLQSQLDRAYYYNPHLSESSPLARLAVLDLADHGRVSPVARTATPTFHDYGHLGGLKLGTLRITNGTASPAPSESTVYLANGQSFAHSDVAGDHFASPGRCRTEVREDGFIPRNFHWQSKQSLPAASHLFLDEKRVVGPDRVPDSTLDVNRSATSGSRRWHHERSKVNALLQDDVHKQAIPGSLSRKQRSMPAYGTSNDLADGASSIAQEYITELPCSPFLQADPHVQGSLNVMSTTKANEFEDNLFEDESFVFATQAASARKPEWSLAVEDAESGHAQGGSREDALRVLNGRTTSTLEQGSCHNPYLGSSTELGRIPSPTQSEKALSKADSGYSSNASLRSLKKEQGLEIVSGMGASDSTSTLTDGGYLLPPKRAPPPPPPPPSDESNAARAIRSVAYSQIFSAGEPLTLGAPNVVDKLGDHHPCSHTTPASSAKSPQHETGPSPIAITQRKLKKGRPLSQPLPAKCITVQGYRELSQSHIPPIPADVAAKLAQRQRSFPLLEHTFPSLQHTSSGDDSTDMPPVSVPIRFPSPTKMLEEATFPVKQQSPPIHTKSSSNHDRPSHSHRPFLDWTKSRRSSRECVTHEEDFPETIADFGTMIDTLGGSPYDIARSVLAETRRPSDSPTWTRSNHTNNEFFREKATGMDEEAAARFARSRSKTRSQGYLGSRTPSSSSFNDRGGIPGKTLRPNSMITDAPPVPALPSFGHSQVGAPGAGKSKSERPVSVPLRESPVIVISGASDATESIDGPPILKKYDKSWEEHRRIWVQRRRSAAEGLLSSGQTYQSTEATYGPASTVAVPSGKKPHGQAATAQPSIEYVAGRYTGGLSYAYEPGYGLGGSAGTRNVKNGASRKSVDVSRGFGIDLSDVPIFIAKTVDC
jgi:hypothetical protein